MEQDQPGDSNTQTIQITQVPESTPVQEPQTTISPEVTPPVPPAPVPTEPKKMNKFLIIGLVILVFLLLGAGGYFAYQNCFANKVVSPSPTPISSPTPSPDPTANWKTYTNNKYGLELKYPPDLIVDSDPNHRGFISGADYYGSRDFNFNIYNPAIEPSHEGMASEATGQPTMEYDGYNFAIFSGESAKNHLSNLEDSRRTGTIASPPLETTTVNISGQAYPLYYLPPGNRPDVLQIPYWFMSFPLNSYNVIITGNYDQNILRQILSTFKFLN